jgi:hypothetical protein
MWLLRMLGRCAKAVAVLLFVIVAGFGLGLLEVLLANFGPALTVFAPSLAAAIALTFWSFREPINYVRAFAIAVLGIFVVIFVADEVESFLEWLFGESLATWLWWAALCIGGACSVFAFPIKAMLRQRRELRATLFLLCVSAIYVVTEPGAVFSDADLAEIFEGPPTDIRLALLIAQHIGVLSVAYGFSRLPGPRQPLFQSAVIERRPDTEGRSAVTRTLSS